MDLHSSIPNEHIGAIIGAIASHSSDSIMVTEPGPGTPIIYVNEAFTALTGYAAEDVVGKSPSLLQGPQTDKSVLERLGADKAAGRVFEGEAINYRSDCSTFLMHWRVVPVTDASGKPAYYVAFQREACTG